MRQTLLNLLIGTLIVETGFFFIEQGLSPRSGIAWRIGFFILMPLGLTILVWLQFRWAAAVCVFYATVGLAMDVATIVQVKELDGIASLMASGVSGLFYLCLILFGWQSFLNADQAQMPPESRPPNLPFPP